MLHLFLIIIAAAINYLITADLSNVVTLLLLYVIGVGVVRMFNRGEHKQYAQNVFVFSYVGCWVYALLCFIFMKHNGYEWLQSLDGYDVYLPYTKDLMGSDMSFIQLVKTIYSESRFSFVGSILILFVYIGKLSTLFGGDIYLNIQFSLMVFGAFTSVVVYRLLAINGFSINKSYKYALIYALLSVHLSQSILIVRDMPITMFYVMIIYLTFKKFEFKNVVLMFLCGAMIMSLRISSAIFSLLYIFIYIYANLFLTKTRGNHFAKFAMVIVFIFTIAGVARYYDQMMLIIIEKNNIYSEMQSSAEQGTSTIASFNSLPFGIRHFVKAMYNQFMDIPAFNTMVLAGNRPQAYNVMNFPDIVSTLFRYFMWIFIIAGFVVKRVRHIIVENKILFLNFVAAFLFILVQSTTMGHRRMMGVYPVFFIIALVAYSNLSESARNRLVVATVFLFAMMQLVGIYYKYL